jgi:glycosyltransferase involved in cell wall biosynthesis
MERRANAIVIGDGPLRPQLEGTARKLSSVRMLGFVNQSEIGRWYGLADVFVMPSEHEPWGLAINEAMAAGSVPVVSEAVGCGPDLVTSESGRIVPVGDVDALAGTLDELVGDDHLLDQMRKRGDQVLANYSIEATARGVEDGAIMATGTGLSS